MSAAPPSRPAGWWTRSRDSARFAFLLRAATIIASSLMALIWSRLLVRTLGNEVYGLFLAFLAVAQLGGLGDLGLSTAVGYRATREFALGGAERCQRFLATARGLTLLLSAGLGLGLAALSGVLPRWLHFQALPAAGPLWPLFAYGGLCAALIILNGYWYNLNYAVGNIVWPMLPGFLLTQATSFAQWRLALSGAPLWQQYLPYVAAALVGLVLTWWFLQMAHPALARIHPLALERAEAVPLLVASFWTYLTTLGNLIYLTTDRLVINGLFGPEYLPAYRFNYRLCELALSVLFSMSFVALPAIVRRLLSAHPQEVADGRSGALRLQILQVVAGCAAGQVYLLSNDLFLRLWLGADYLVPWTWQTAFAAILALSVAGDFGNNLAMRLDGAAVRLGGLVFAGTGLVNLALSLLAARAGSIVGIAVATVVAQAIATAIMNSLSCRLLSVPRFRWLLRAIPIPLAAMLLAGLIRAALPFTSPGHVALALALNLLLFLALLAAVGANRALWAEEWSRIRATLLRSKA